MIEVIVGTYEEFLLGYQFSVKKPLEQSFAAHDHTGSIRAVTLSGQYLASGGADDRILIYDLGTRKEVCCLTHHKATITALKFTPNHSHLISGSSDGVLAIVRVGNWQLEKIWEKPHNRTAILDLAVHESGKLALSLGADCSLCTWNLVKGRQAYVINLNSKSNDAKSLEKIVWASDGTRFLLYGGRYVEIWSIESGGILDFVENNERVTCCLWFTESSLLIGHENGTLTLVDIDEKNKRNIQAHDARIKAMKMHKEWIITISSNGQIKIWNHDFEQVTSIETGCRPTCLEIVPTVQVKKEKTENPEPVVNQEEEEVVFKPYVVVETEEDTNEVHKRPKRQSNEPIKKKKKKKTK